jgi:PAS domain S-box-containing protein
MKRLSIENQGENNFKVLSLIDHLPAGVVVHAPDTSILYSNTEASRLLGLSKDQLQGKVAIDPTWCFVQEDGTPMPIEEYPVNKAISTQQPLINFEGGIREPESGDMVWVLVNAVPEFNEKHELSQVVVTFVDITLRKQAENEMRILSEIVEGMIHTKEHR